MVIIAFFLFLLVVFSSYRSYHEKTQEYRDANAAYETYTNSRLYSVLLDRYEPTAADQVVYAQLKEAKVFSDGLKRQALERLYQRAYDFAVLFVLTGVGFVPVLLADRKQQREEVHGVKIYPPFGGSSNHKRDNDEMGVN